MRVDTVKWQICPVKNWTLFIPQLKNDPNNSSFGQEAVHLTSEK